VSKPVYRRDDSGPLTQQLLHEFAAAEQHANAVLHDTSACGYPHYGTAATMAEGKD
jgi:hypothetical protein